MFEKRGEQLGQECCGHARALILDLNAQYFVMLGAINGHCRICRGVFDRIADNIVERALQAFCVAVQVPLFYPAVKHHVLVLLLGFKLCVVHHGKQ